MMRLLLLLGVVLLTACSTRNGGPPPQPVPSMPLGPFAADLLLSVDDGRGGSTRLSLVLARNGRNLLRARIRKVDHVIAELAVAGDRLDCWLPRPSAVSATGVRYVGPVDAPGLPILIRHIGLFADELERGPVPVATLFDEATQAWGYLDRGVRARLEVNAFGSVTEKELHQDQRLLARLRYTGGSPVTVVGVQRPYAIEITTPDGGQLSAQFAAGEDPVRPGDREDRLMAVPEDAAQSQRVDARDLLRAMETMQ